MNQSPKKNKYIIKNQKLCSIPFLAIQPSSNTYSAHGKPLRSQQRLGTYAGKISSKGVQPQATGGILDAKFLYLGKRDPPGSQLPAFHWWAFTQEQFDLVLFQEVSAKHTGGLSQSLALGRGAGSMKGVHVTHGSGSKFLYQCLLDVHLKLCCSPRLAVLLAPASRINYSIAPPAFRDLPRERAEGKEAFSEQRRDWVGREGQAPCLCFIEWLCKREYCIRNRRLCLISPQPLDRKPANNRSSWFARLLFVGFFLFFLFFLHK